MKENLKEIAFGIGKIGLGLIVVVGLMLVLDIFVFLTATGSTFSEKVALAFNEGYDEAYTQTYDASYQNAYNQAFDKGYQKGYEMGRGQTLADKGGRLVQLHNPTFQEMTDFLEADTTNEHEYIIGEYVCYDFTADLNNAAEAAGLRAAYVRLRTYNWAHAIVAFDTTDRGIIYIEPQSDKMVDIELGEPYPWWQVGAASPFSNQAPLTEIQVIW